MFAPESAAPAQAATHAAPDLSVIIPLHNEEENVRPLLERLFAQLTAMPFSFEVLVIDDGSTDDSYRALQREAAERPQLKVIRFRRNYGQTAAMMAGIDFASGRTLISLDADLQNDPADIPALLQKLDEGFDVVSGWRTDRKDARFRRRLTSQVASRVISGISGVQLHDYGCTLKAYRRDVVKGIKLYGEMHRFIPIYARWMGARVTEVPVQHHPRTHGVSKYGLERVLKVVLDMMVVKFLERYFVKPIYVFGAVGLTAIFLSLVALAWAVYLRMAQGVSIMQTPLPLLSALLFFSGTTSILMGLIAEMTVRTYFESQQRPPYLIRESVNI